MKKYKLLAKAFPDIPKKEEYISSIHDCPISFEDDAIEWLNHNKLMLFVTANRNPNDPYGWGVFAELYPKKNNYYTQLTTDGEVMSLEHASIYFLGDLNNSFWIDEEQIYVSERFPLGEIEIGCPPSECRYYYSVEEICPSTYIACYAFYIIAKTEKIARKYAKRL